MNLFNQKIKLFFLLALLSTSLAAQSLFFSHYTTDNGLPLNPVYSILQDAQGYIWIGTEGGVAKYDGFDFIEYNLKDGLVSPHVNEIFEDTKGNIWFGTIGGISKFDGEHFTNYTTREGLSENYIYSIQEDYLGGIWFGTSGGGAAYLFNGVIKNFNKTNGFNGESVLDIARDWNGDIWFATEGQGVIKKDDNGFTTINCKDGLVCDSINSILVSTNNELVFGSKKGVSIFANSKFTNYGIDKGASPFAIKDIFEDQNNDFWLCYDGGGIARFDEESFVNYTGKEGIPSNIVQTGIEDARGDLWFGTLSGAIRIKAERVQTLTEEQGLSGEIVYTINQDKNGNYLFGSYDTGLNVFSNGKFRLLTTEDGLPSINIAASYVDDDNTIWLGTDKGISKWKDGSFTNYTVEDGLVGNVIFTITKDHDGNLWFGGENGVSRYDGKSFTNFKTEDGIAPAWVYCSYEDSDGNMWFGSDGGGITFYDGKKFVIYNSSNGLPHGAIMDILQDRFGNYWFALEGGGIVRYDGEQFKSFSTSEGISNNICYSIIEQGKYLYIGTGKGITRLDYSLIDLKPSEAIRIFTREDGLPSDEITQGAVFEDLKGSIWFGTQAGLVSINPSNKPLKFEPPIYFQKISINNLPINIDSARINSLELDPDQNVFNFEFTAISFDSPEKLKVFYKLEGLKDTNWVLTNGREVSFPYLPHGEYTFEVKAQNGDGLWSREPASISFLLNAPFYTKWWFYVLVFMFLSSIAYTLYLFKTEQVKKRNIELAKMVRLRTKELEDEKDKSDELLMNILPESAVDELKINGEVEPREFKNTSILFTDFKGFTWTASVLPADKLVNELNDVFGSFDKIMIKYGIEKLKTIGDSYMAASGLPNSDEHHALKIIEAAFAMQKYIDDRNKDAAIKWEMRLGIHSGQVVAGVVGVKKFTYDIWGDTVNIASRMESSGEPGKINISAFTYMLVRDYYECEYRGKVEAKGKGKIDMYFIVGRKQKLLDILDSLKHK